MSIFQECPNCAELIGKNLDVCPLCHYNQRTHQIEKPIVHSVELGDKFNIQATTDAKTPRYNII